MNQSNYQNTATNGHRFKEYAIEQVLSLLDKEIDKKSKEAKVIGVGSIHKYRLLSENAGIHIAQRIINRYLNSIKKEVRNAKR